MSLSIHNMSLLTAKSALTHNLLKVTALFALAESCLLATSFCVYANNQSRLASSSPFGIKSRSYSLPSRSIRLSSSIAEENVDATMETKTPAVKLEELRAKMKELSLDCYIIPSDDPHLSGECVHCISIGLEEVKFAHLCCCFLF